MAVDGLSQSATNNAKTGQFTAFASQLTSQNEVQNAIDDRNQILSSAGPETLDFEVNLSEMQSPEYSNEVNTKANGSRKRQIDALNIKKTQSMKRMMLQKQDSSGVSPTSQAAIHMHNSIALLN